MDKKQNRLSLEEIKKIDLVDYLSSLGFEPAKPPRGADYYYRSPFREENTASFHVDRRKNSWYDHGPGIGGNLIDFAIKYFNCTVGEFYQQMQGDFSFHQPTPRPAKSLQDEPEKKIEIVEEKPLVSYPLLKYVRARRIDMEMADKFLREISFRINEKSYYGVGFKNRSGGWEIRNPYMKCASNPKDITVIDNGSANVHVFEGFFDFLSFATIFKNDPVMHENFCVLNGTGMVKHAIYFLDPHQQKNLYLDNGKGGNNVTSFLLGSDESYVDHRAMYSKYGDLNEWHVNIGKPPQRKSRRIT